MYHIPTVAMVHDVRVSVADVGARSNQVCATCPIVAMDEVRPLLLGHHISDGIAATSHLPVAKEGYGLLLQRLIVVVNSALTFRTLNASECTT
jgi:hypothetical protein